MTAALPESMVGAVVPLPHLGPDRSGTVLGHSWSESLGRILRVRDHASGGGAMVLVYGEDLVGLLAGLTGVAGGVGVTAAS